MDERLLRDLIHRSEQLDVEFKSGSRHSLSDQDIVDPVVCLANLPAGYDRGYLLIGVEDSGTITGARPRHGARTDGDKLAAMIFGNTEPSIESRIAVVDVPAGEVIAIVIPRTGNICATKHGRVTRRISGLAGPACVPFYPHQHQSYRSDLGLIDVSAQPHDDLDWRAIDPVEIHRLQQTITRLGGDRHLEGLDDVSLIKALNLAESRGERLVSNVAGLLLLGRQDLLNRVIPNHDVRFQAFGPTGDVLANELLSTPLLRMLEDIEQRFAARNSEQEVLVGMIRLPVPDYASDAFREAVNNAVLHRDYSQHNAVYVQWHPNRMLITNPGGFMRGITLDNLLVHEPVPRNPRLADAFRRVGLVERTGRGIDKIFDGQLRYGRPIPDYTQSDPTAVRVTMASEHANLEFAHLVFEQQGHGRIQSLDHLLILDQLRRERRTNAALAARAIQKSEPIARAVLERLVEWGLAEAKGERRGRVYLLSASMYRRLGEAAGYVRTRGFDRIQQEVMVLQFVSAHGEVRRADVVELCTITPREATTLLSNMSRRGLLTKRGSDRGTHYVAGPSS